MNKSQIVSILRYALAILGGGMAGAGMGHQLGNEPGCPPCVDQAPVVEPAPMAPVEVPVTVPAEAVGLPE